MHATETTWQRDADTYYQLRSELVGDAARENVHSKVQMAMAYVWGWQDRRGEVDSDAALAFGYAYGAHCARFALERCSMRRNVGDAFKRWRAGESIEGN